MTVLVPGPRTALAIGVAVVIATIVTVATPDVSTQNGTAAVAHKDVAADPDVLGAERLFSAWMEGQLAYRGLPGVVVGVVSDQTLVWAKGFGFADIKDWVYDTSLPGGNGTAGGPVIVKIEGFDPSQTEKPDKAGETLIKPLFPAYQTTADLPKEATTKDFDVPATAGAGTGKPGEPIIP